jgi:Tat protein secretion system quality control protein TatD with DNase activity
MREVGAGEGNRTLVLSLEGSCSTIELHPHYLKCVAVSKKSATFWRHATTHNIVLVGEVGLEPTKP